MDTTKRSPIDRLLFATFLKGRTSSRHLVAHHAAAQPARPVHPDHLHLCEHLERLPWPPDLPDQDRTQDNPDRSAYVHHPVFCRVRPDHGGLCGGTDPGADRVPLPAEILRAGRGIHRHQGLNKSPVSGAWAVPAPRIFCRNRGKTLCYILNRMKRA